MEAKQINGRDGNEQLIVLAQALADPLRLTILQHLMAGPASVSELLSVTGEAQSKVSNHLALLRERGLVQTTREGRQVVYQLADAPVAQLVESLSAVAGATPPKQWKSPQVVKARTCYDHLAGRFGVALFDALVAQGALEEPEAVQGYARGDVALGPAAGEVFAKLGIDTAGLQALRRERRRFATACLDWTERRPHLGGALGAALWAQCVERGWVVKQPGTRAVVVTAAGKEALRDLLGVTVAEEAL